MSAAERAGCLEANEAADIMRRHGTAALLERLADAPPLDRLSSLRELTTYLFNVETDPVRGIEVGCAAAAYALALAAGAPGIHGLDRRLRDEARALYFNVASMTWPGWRDAATARDETVQRVGRDSAASALALAESLAVDTPTMARTRWLVGVHALFAEELEAARHELARSLRLLEEGGREEEVRLLRAYLLMVQAVARPDDPEVLFELERMCAAFDGRAEGEAFALQLRTAWRALAPNRPLVPAGTA